MFDSFESVFNDFCEADKVARRPWAPRIVLEFPIETRYVPWLLKNILLSLIIFRRPLKFLNSL